MNINTPGYFIAATVSMCIGTYFSVSTVWWAGLPLYVMGFFFVKAAFSKG